MTRTFRRELSSLDDVFMFLKDFSERHELDESVSYVLNLAVEELFTNMVKYAPHGDPEIPVSLDLKPGRVILRLVDEGVEPFDVTQVKGRDLDRPTMERRPGGLGLHLVRQMVDEIDYHFKDGCSTISIVKLLES